jgi:hypothetical protein
MIVNEYRRRAAECLCVADEISGPRNKMLLIAVAQAWLKLAQKIEEANPGTHKETGHGKRGTSLMA